MTMAKKKKSLRYNEYYNIQEVYDQLYLESNEGNVFKNLYEIIISEENIKLAYRNIKKNRGSKTSGTNRRTILDIGVENVNDVISYVRRRLNNYQPQTVKRKLIPKPNGDLRPLGIPTIEDRLIQQCIKQVLEPICEAKFFNESYGFRPNRSTQHAIAKFYSYVHSSKCLYSVDVDIKGFFDNVNHGKLLKQIWSLGIQDKKLISIISKMLKAEMKNEGKSSKGVPQGGILSPLLSNIVLNELDWWIASQWIEFPAKQRCGGNGKGNFKNLPYKNNSNKLNALRNGTKLKQCFFVRYADDFRILTNSYENAKKLYIATINWLKERLNLEVNERKSSIVNLKKNYTEFLGIKIKVQRKKKRYVIKSHMVDEEKIRIKSEIRKKIDEIENSNTPKEVYKLNSLIIGVHNYYSIATNVNRDFSDIENDTLYRLKQRWKKCVSHRGHFSETYKKHYGQYAHRKQYFMHKIALYPISGIKFRRPTLFNSRISNYTDEGRKLVHDKLINVNQFVLKHIMENPIVYRSIEYNDNRISLYSAQHGRCFVTGLELTINDMECHHKIPRQKGGTDEYSNLVYLLTNIHLLVHTNNDRTQKRLMKRYSLQEEEMKKINELRKLVGNYNITF